VGKSNTNKCYYFYDISCKNELKFSHHRCPHRPWGIVGKGDQPCSVTEYKNEFRQHDGARRQPFKPDNEYKSTNAPLQDETTHK
jgi:hypothetical protein